MATMIEMMNAQLDKTAERVTTLERQREALTDWCDQLDQRCDALSHRIEHVQHEVDADKAHLEGRIDDLGADSIARGRRT